MVFEIASNNRQRHSPRAFKVPVSTHRSSNLNNPTSLSTSLLPYPHQIMIPSQDKPTPRETVPVLNINVLLLSVSASSDLLRAAQDLVHRVSKRVRNTTIIRAKALPGSTTKVISSKQVRITLHAVLILPYSKPLSVEAAAHLDTLRTIPDIILRIHPIISMQASGYGQTLYRALHTGQLGEIAHTLSQAAFVLPSESNEQGPIELSLGLMRAFVDVISQLLCSHLALSNATRFRFQAMLGRPTITIYLGAGEDRMRSADEEQLVTRAIRIANASVKLLNRNAAAYLGAVGLEELGQDKHPELAHRPTHATPSSSARPRTANVSASCSGPSRDPVARTPSPELLRTAPGSAPVFLVARLDCGIDIRVGEPSPGASASPPPPAYPAQPRSSGAHVPQHTPSPYRALADRREDPKPRTRPPRRPHTAAQVENVQHVTPALRFLKPLERTAPLLACHHISAPLTSSPPSPPPQAPIIITHPVEGTPEAYKIPVLSHFPEKAYRVLGHHHLQTRSHYIKSATLRNPLSSRSRTSDEKSGRFPRLRTERPPAGMVFPEDIQTSTLPARLNSITRSQFLIPPSPPVQNLSSPEPSPLLSSSSEFPMPPRPPRSGARPRTAPTKSEVVEDASEADFWRRRSGGGLDPPAGEGLQRQLDLAGRAFKRNLVWAPTSTAKRPGDGQRLSAVEEQPTESSLQVCGVGGVVKGILIGTEQIVRKPSVSLLLPPKPIKDTRESSLSRIQSFRSVAASDRSIKDTREGSLSRIQSFRSVAVSERSMGSVYSSHPSTVRGAHHGGPNPESDNEEDDQRGFIEIASLIQARRRRADDDEHSKTIIVQ